MLKIWVHADNTHAHTHRHQKLNKSEFGKGGYKERWWCCITVATCALSSFRDDLPTLQLLLQTFIQMFSALRYKEQLVTSSWLKMMIFMFCLTSDHVCVHKHAHTHANTHTHMHTHTKHVHVYTNTYSLASSFYVLQNFTSNTGKGSDIASNDTSYGSGRGHYDRWQQLRWVTRTDLHISTCIQQYCPAMIYYLDIKLVRCNKELSAEDNLEYLQNNWQFIKILRILSVYTTKFGTVNCFFSPTMHQDERCMFTYSLLHFWQRVGVGGGDVHVIQFRIFHKKNPGHIRGESRLQKLCCSV